MSFIRDAFFGGAEKKAGNAQERAAQAAIAEQQRQDALNREGFAGTAGRGEQAGAQEANFLGLNGRAAEQGAIDSFIESPGQAFLRQRAERSLLRNSAAIGGLGGGNVREELNRQGIGIAATQLSERKNRLASVAGRGDNAIANRAGFGTQISNNIANLRVGEGDARASGILGKSAGIRNGIARVAGAFI